MIIDNWLKIFTETMNQGKCIKFLKKEMKSNFASISIKLVSIKLEKFKKSLENFSNYLKNKEYRDYIRELVDNL